MALLSLALLILIFSILKYKCPYYLYWIFDVVVISMCTAFFSALHFSGQDWENYQYIFTSFDPEVLDRYEPFFVFVFSLLMKITRVDYFLSVEIYYLLMFILFYVLFYINKMKVEYWLIIMVIAFGNTLFTDQLRQLLAVFFSVMSFIIYLKHGRHNLYSCMAIAFAFFSHYSALIIVIYYLSLFIKSDTKFMFLSIFVGIFCYFILTSGVSTLISTFSINISSADKINFYVNENDGSFGVLSLFSLVYILYSLFDCVLMKRTIGVFERIFFLAAVIQLSIVLAFPALSRLIVYNIALSALWASFYMNNTTENGSSFLKLRVSTLFIFIVLLSWQFASFYSHSSKDDVSFFDFPKFNNIVL